MSHYFISQYNNEPKHKENQINRLGYLEDFLYTIRRDKNFNFIFLFNFLPFHSFYKCSSWGAYIIGSFLGIKTCSSLKFGPIKFQDWMKDKHYLFQYIFFWELLFQYIFWTPLFTTFIFSQKQFILIYIFQTCCK